MSASIVEDSLLPWLLTVAKNLIRNELRRRQYKLHRRELPAEVSTTSSAQEDMVWMRLEMEQLDLIDLEICRLCLEEGWPTKMQPGSLKLAKRQ
jgi:DNA-directed RNA polymerase specialized sigma24 family protein